MAIYIEDYSNPTPEGVNIKFNKPVSLNGGMATDQWYVSWDKIGKALVGSEYDTTARKTDQ